MTNLRKASWLLFLTLVFVTGWYKTVENQRDQRQQKHWQQFVERFSREGRTERGRIEELLSDVQEAPDSRSRLESELNEGVAFDVVSEGEISRATWVDPSYGIRVEMVFAGPLVRYGTQWDPSIVHELHPRPDSTSLLGWSENARASIARFAPKVWLGLFAAALFSPVGRVILFEALLANSLVCSVAWLTSPDHRMTVQGILSNESLYYAVFMFGASLTLLACRTAQENPTSQNLRFRFGIKRLVGATTLIAVATATRPFGVVVAMTIFFGVVYLALIRAKVQRGFLRTG